jgi:hypothetical protein
MVRHVTKAEAARQACIEETSAVQQPAAERVEAFVEFKRLDARPELDGLRAIAVTSVVLYHFNCDVRGGFAGVDVFFVISGYLVTGILLYELSVGKFSFRHFFASACSAPFSCDGCHVDSRAGCFVAPAPSRNVLKSTHPDVGRACLRCERPFLQAK